MEYVAAAKDHVIGMGGSSFGVGLGVGLALEDRECGALRVGNHREAPVADFGGRQRLSLLAEKARLKGRRCGGSEAAKPAQQNVPGS